MNPPKPSTDPTVIFVLGLLGLLMCQVLGPVALFMGHKYRRECKELGVEPEGLGTAGWALGIVGTILFGLTLLAILAYVAFFVIYFLFVVVFVGLAVASGA